MSILCSSAWVTVPRHRDVDVRGEPFTGIVNHLYARSVGWPTDVWGVSLRCGYILQLSAIKTT